MAERVDVNLRPQTKLYQKVYHKAAAIPTEAIKYAQQYVPKLHDIGEDNLSDYEPIESTVDEDDYNVIDTLVEREKPPTPEEDWIAV